MPYKRIGTKLFSKSSGKWKIKQIAKSTDNAKKTLGLLYGLETKSFKEIKKSLKSRKKRSASRLGYK